MKLVILPDNITIDVEKPEKLMTVLQRHNISLGDDLCGHGNCGRCKVVVTRGNSCELSVKEKEVLSDTEIKESVRLACDLLVTEDTCIFRNNAKNEMKNNGSPLEVKKIKLRADMEYAIVADVGTTNIECGLFVKGRIKPLGAVSAPNPQRLMGPDVISRIAYCNNEMKIKQLSKMARGCVRNLSEKLVDINNESVCGLVLCGNPTMVQLFLNMPVEGLGRYPFTTGYNGDEVLLAKDYIDGFNVGAKLFVPPFIGGHLGADALSCLYAAIGQPGRSDVTANGGVKDSDAVTDRVKDSDAVTDQSKDSDTVSSGAENTLVVDIGTNAEIILKTRDEYFGASAAAGPAFEGMGLKYGRKFGENVITGAGLDEEGKIFYQVFGLGRLYGGDPHFCKVKGFSASAALDILCVLRKLKLLNRFGTFVKNEQKCIEYDIINKRFYLSRSNSNVSLDQADIRNLQLAKSAVRSGMDTLLMHKGIGEDAIGRIVLAGAFGNNMNLESAIRSGMLYDIPLDRYELIGNGAMLGAAALAFSENAVKAMSELAKKTEHTELGEDPVFTERFVENINL